jgi:NADPH:quinone reductase
VGVDVKWIHAGESVLGVGLGGAYAEHTIARQGELFRSPTRMDSELAACFRVSHLTAFHALVQRAGLRKGETVLVLGAAGAVGLAAVQLAKALGATVIASASTDPKRQLAHAGGADTVIDSGDADWRALVRNACGGGGPDVVVDPVGGTMDGAGISNALLGEDAIW